MDAWRLVNHPRSHGLDMWVSVVAVMALATLYLSGPGQAAMPPITSAPREMSSTPTPPVTPGVTVTKEATPSQAPGMAWFTLTVRNDSAAPLRIMGLEDSAFGDLTTTNDLVRTTTCATGLTIQPGGAPFTCSFEAFVSGRTGDAEVSLALVRPGP